MLRGPRGRLWAACVCVGLAGFVGVVAWVNSSVSQTALALSIDIRATAALSASTKEWSFVAAVEDCSAIAGARSNHPDPEQAILVRRELLGGGCEFSMKLPEPERLNPSVVISFSDGSQALGYTEAFALERVAAGKAPYVQRNGAFQRLNLHHSRQDARGSLFELGERTHLRTRKGAGSEALHPYGRMQHPDYPVDRPAFRKDRRQYWIDRASEVNR